MTDHTGCCCTEALNDHLALKAAYWAACQALAATDGRLLETTAERDRARTTATRLEAELARGFRITAPPATLTRHDEDRPATPNHPDNGDGIVQIRPGSGNTPPDTHGPERGPDTGGKAKHV